MKNKFTVKKSGKHFTSENLDVSCTNHNRCHCCGQPINTKTAVEMFTDGYFISSDEQFISEQNEGAYVAIYLGPDCAASIFKTEKRKALKSEKGFRHTLADTESGFAAWLESKAIREFDGSVTICFGFNIQNARKSEWRTWYDRQRAA